MDWWLIALLVLAGVACIAVIFGFVFKKRFRRGGRIYSFTAYEPDEDCDHFSPAHVCGKNRFYSRLFRSNAMPRYTSRLSFVPFISNRKNVRAVEFSATSYCWERSDAIRVRVLGENEKLWVVKDAKDIDPHDDIQIPRSALADGGSTKNEYIINPGDAFAIQKGDSYIFYFYRMKR